MTKLSVIIPVYNTPQDLLEHCLSSVKENLSTMAGDVEILLLNDGSTEPDIEPVLKQAEAADERFRYICKPSNTGLSDTRNVGMSHAQGEYIIFVDSDDYLEPDALSCMLTTIEESKADLAVFGYCKNDEKPVVPRYQKMLSREEILEFAETIVYDMENRGRQTRLSYPYAWGKIYRKSIIQEHHILYEPKVGPREDMDFNMRYLLHVKNMFVDNKITYHYVDNDSSLTHAFSKGLIPYASLAQDLMEKYMIAFQIPEEIRTKVLSIRMLSEIRNAREHYYTHPQNRKSFWELKAEMDSFLSEPTIKKWIKKLRLSDARDALELKNMILLKLNLYWYFLITERRKRRR